MSSTFWYEKMRRRIEPAILGFAVAIGKVVFKGARNGTVRLATETL